MGFLVLMSLAIVRKQYLGNILYRRMFLPSLQQCECPKLQFNYFPQDVYFRYHLKVSLSSNFLFAGWWEPLCPSSSSQYWSRCRGGQNPGLSHGTSSESPSRLLGFQCKMGQKPTHNVSCGAHACFMSVITLNASSTIFCVSLCIILLFNYSS